MSGSSLALLCALLLLPAFAQAQKVTADLSQEVTAVGQPVQLQIKVSGGAGARLDTEALNIPGLQILSSTSSQQFTFGSGGSGLTTTYNFVILPTEEGEYTIPAMDVNIRGRKAIQTQALTLKVGGNSGGVPVLPAIPVHPSQQQQSPSGSGMPSYLPPAGQQAPQAPRGRNRPAAAPSEPAFGELIIPKKTAFVGEVVPVELRFYFSSHYPVRLADRPNFSGDGFTVLNFSKPVQREQEIDGELYNMVVFQTAITAVKAGALEVVPATIEAQITMPGSAPQNSDDFFSNFFGNSGFGMDVRQITVSTKPMALEVKPLPKEGRPDDFSGAIGQFTLQASASPKKAAAGDPITLSTVVSGRGNFGAIGAPTLMDSENWKSYPPSEKFEASSRDPIGFNGEKTFDFMIVARADTTQTPSPEFSFFDPAVERYVTLKAEPIAVVAKGGTAAAPAATAVATAPTPTPAPDAPTPPPASTDQLASNFQPASFDPLVLKTGFLIINAVAAVGWLALLLFSLGRAAVNSSYAQNSARRRESRRLLQQIDDLSATPEQFYQGAETFIRTRLAPEGSNLDSRELLSRAAVPQETKDKVASILDRADEGRYSTGSVAHLGAEERQAIFKQLKTFDEQLGA